MCVCVFFRAKKNSFETSATKIILIIKTYLQNFIGTHTNKNIEMEYKLVVVGAGGVGECYTFSVFTFLSNVLIYRFGGVV